MANYISVIIIKNKCFLKSVSFFCIQHIKTHICLVTRQFFFFFVMLYLVTIHIRINNKSKNVSKFKKTMIVKKICKLRKEKNTK